ncbi:MAG: penicillin-binding transpeptidase domain-containing protein [Bdellovibrionota bacterium]
MQRQNSNAKWWGLALTLSLLIVSFHLLTRPGSTSSERVPASPSFVESQGAIDKELLATQMGPSYQKNLFPEAIDLSFDGSTQRLDVSYSLDTAINEQMNKLLAQYHPDYGVFVAMDAKTGRIISMNSFSASEPASGNLALQARFPAASIFKIVTASAAIDMRKAQSETVVPFNGANHTLYKRNVQDTRVNRWTRKMSMREAFGRSVNVFFGKMGLFMVGPENLKTYADRYLFNQPIHSDMLVEMGETRFDSQDPWSVVTAASGFTRDTTMSPLQGAMMAAAVANDGLMMEPYIVEDLRDVNGALMYEAQPRLASTVVDVRAAEELRELFHETVRSGTSRKSFRQIVRGRAYDDVEFGGKTGSLTGTNPQGKCDWFVGYARFGDQRIAVAALTVNEKKWRVKSSMLAKLFFDRYLKMNKNQAFAQNVR